MIDSKLKGNLTELECLTEFAKLGAVVSIPFGEDSRYDFIADVNGKLIKVQCKTCSEIKAGEDIVGISFKTVRQSGNFSSHWKRVKYSKEEIDYFSTFYNGKCYLIPVEECSNEKRLRFTSTNNGQKLGINMAKDYEMREVISKL